MKRLLLGCCFTLTVLATLPSCTGGSTLSGAAGGDTLRLRYATRLQAVRHEGYTVATIADPWHEGRALHTYVLVPADAPLPPHLPKGSVVRTPLRRAVVATSVHCGLIHSFGREGSIAGVCDLQYINLPYVQAQHKAGRIADCGSGLSPTIEKILDLRPDAIFLSPFQNSGGYGKLENIDVPIVEMADYMETSALGRAEWMRFYGMLFGAEREADSLFRAVEANYLRLARLAAASGTRRAVVMDKQVGPVWYVPGGGSTIGRLIADAAASYPWSGDARSGSVALPFESVLEKAGQADVWLFRYNAPRAATLASLLAENRGYGQFRAFRRGEVYGCNTATTTFYEDTPFHPDLLLRDLIVIAHPELRPQLGEPAYFAKLKP